MRQQSKTHCHACLLLQHIAIPQRRFAHLHIDLVGPLHYSSNCNYVFTVIDCTSKWKEAIPLSDLSTAACARALIFSWISPFWVPKKIPSDHGPHFTSNVWSQLCKMLNITHCQTTACHPEANGAVKPLHRRLKDALHAHAAAATWARSYPGYSSDFAHSQPRENTGLSPVEAVFLELQLSCQMRFCMEKKFLLTTF